MSLFRLQLTPEKSQALRELIATIASGEHSLGVAGSVKWPEEIGLRIKRDGQTVTIQIEGEAYADLLGPINPRIPAIRADQSGIQIEMGSRVLEVEFT